jgi:2-hydroxy-3-keto-5-methylthiopentenyl-1-phosphate phosphatase
MLRASLAPHGSLLLRVHARIDLAVFCDFDGTFARLDVGSTIARTYVPERRAELWRRYERGEMGAWEYNEALLGGLRLPEPELEVFLRGVELDAGAPALVAWCEARGVPFRVLSDGFDRNLDRLQELHGVRFGYDANRLWYEGGAWRIAPGHPDPSCPCGTGTCKRGRIRAFRAAHPSATVVHVGDGRVSDLCAALEADLVFAKHTLADELRERGVAFEPFEDLRDVVGALERRFGSA